MKSHVDEMIFDLANAIAKAEEYDRIAALPSCNNCGKVKECEYRPKYGEHVRINCPIWEAEKK